MTMTTNDGYDLDAEIDGLRGSPLAKKRLKVVLGTLTGKMLPKEACRVLGIDEAELKQLQLDFVDGALRGCTAWRDSDPSQN
jgi:hypothetical protein